MTRKITTLYAAQLIRNCNTYVPRLLAFYIAIRMQTVANQLTLSAGSYSREHTAKSYIATISG